MDHSSKKQITELEKHVQLAKAYYKGKKMELALSECQQALSIDSNLVSMHILHSQIMLFLGKYDLAEKEVSTILILDPSSAEAQNLLSVILAKKGQIKDAKEILIKAIERNSRFWKFRYNLALLYYGERDFHSAASEFWLAYKSYPSLSPLSGLLVSLYFAYPKVAGLLFAVSIILPVVNQSPFSFIFTAVAIGYIWSAGCLNLNLGNKLKGSFTFAFGLVILILHMFAVLS